MRIAILAAALFMLTGPALAQTEMDRAESAVRDSMAAEPGIAVERVSPDEIRIRMPSDITFDFDRAEVKRQFMPRVHDLARTLNAYPSLSIAIIGHADALGSDHYNLELSERRAHAVGAALMSDGVPYRRIAASGRGEWEPIASNAHEWGRAQNRRVEIRLNSKQK